MRLTRLYLRFFRSFNFDYERKANSAAVAKEWEKLDGSWYPFVRVDLDPAVTAIVGANESGKTHLVEAISQALTGEGISRADFCRYSALFSVEEDQVRKPDFGIEFEMEDDQDVAVVAGIYPEAGPGDRLMLLRLDAQPLSLVDATDSVRQLDEQQRQRIQEALPAPFKLATNVPLPDSISFDVLLERETSRLTRRRRRFEFLDYFRDLDGDITAETITQSAGQIAGMLDRDAAPRDQPAETISREELGRKLLLDVAKIDRAAVTDLEDALREGHEGQVGGLIEEMNRALARHLNFNRWWTQDQDFQLRLAPRERELVFTIRDRTGTDYSFEERSRGLTYFLGCFVQLRAHTRSATREILLIDEPDAYLSMSDSRTYCVRSSNSPARMMARVKTRFCT